MRDKARRSPANDTQYTISYNHWPQILSLHTNCPKYEYGNKISFDKKKKKEKKNRNNKKDIVNESSFVFDFGSVIFPIQNILNI